MARPQPDSRKRIWPKSKNSWTLGISKSTHLEFFQLAVEDYRCQDDWSDKIKYLGIILNRKLTFSERLRGVRNRASAE
ncbi:hypothetical protein Trydic_g13160 [Trypoxylus dichotomus]